MTRVVQEVRTGETSVTGISNTCAHLVEGVLPLATALLHGLLRLLSTLLLQLLPTGCCLLDLMKSHTPECQNWPSVPQLHRNRMRSHPVTLLLALLRLLTLRPLLLLAILPVDLDEVTEGEVDGVNKVHGSDF